MAATPPGGEFTAALLVADEAMQRVLGDRQGWAAEAANKSAGALPWPLQQRGNNYPQLLRILAVQAVEVVLEAMRQADGIHVEPDPAYFDFQVILRMVRRAVDAADDALRAEFGGKRGGHRLGDKRQFQNWAKAQEVDAAMRSGGPRADALKKLSISRSAAYRAMKRR